MPKIIIRGDVLASGNPFQLEGFPRRPVTSVFVQEGIIERETAIQITGIPDVPNPVVTAHILGLPPSAQASTTITTLQAELRLQDGQVQEPYDPANWTWAVVSGGGSFGGVNNDELTLPAAPATVVISATHPESGLSTTANVEVVGTVQRVLDIYNVPSSVIQGEQYTLLARERDGATNEVLEDPAIGVTFSVASGPATITGGNVLNINAGSAPGSVQISATKPGVTSDSNTYSVIVQPTFPAVLYQPDMATELNIDGSTKSWGAGWQTNPRWDDDTFVSVISDPNSKFGQVIEKRMFVGDTSGWNGLTHNNNFTSGNREMYARFVFAPSSNWGFHPGTGDKLFYWGRKIGSESPTQYYLQLRPNRDIWVVVQNVYARNPLVSAAFAPQGVGKVALGTYNTVEVLHRLNSPGNADGSLRFALNGNIATEFLSPVNDTDPTASAVEWVDPTKVVNGETFSPLEWSGGQFFRFWGGSGATQDVNDNWRVSEVFIAGRN